MSANDKGSIFFLHVFFQIMCKRQPNQQQETEKFQQHFGLPDAIKKSPPNEPTGHTKKELLRLKGETTVRLCPSKFFQALMAGWLYISIHILHFQPGHIAKHGTILQLYLLKDTKNPDPKFHMIHHCESRILDHRLVAYIWFRFGQFVLYIIVHLIRDSSQNVLSKIGC